MINITRETGYLEISSEDIINDEMLGPCVWVQMATGTNPSLQVDDVDVLPSSLATTCGIISASSSNFLKISVFTSSIDFTVSEVGALSQPRYYTLDGRAAFTLGDQYVCFLIQLLELRNPGLDGQFLELNFNLVDQMYFPEVIGPSTSVAPTPYEGITQKYLPGSFEISELDFYIGVRSTDESNINFVTVQCDSGQFIIPVCEPDYLTYGITNPNPSPVPTKVIFSTIVDLRVTINGYGEAPPPTYDVNNSGTVNIVPNAQNNFFIRFANKFVTDFPVPSLSPTPDYIDLGNNIYMITGYGIGTQYAGTGEGLYTFTEIETYITVQSGVSLLSYIGSSWSNEINYGKLIRYDRFISKNLAVVGSDFTLSIYANDLSLIYTGNFVDGTTLGTIPEFSSFVDGHGLNYGYYVNILVNQNSLLINPLLVGVAVYESNNTSLMTKATPRYRSLSKIIDPTPESFPITVTNNTWGTSIIIDSPTHPALFKARGQSATHYVLDVPFEGTIEFSAPTVVSLSEVNTYYMPESSEGSESYYTASNLETGALINVWRNTSATPLIFASTINTLFKYVGVHWKTGTIKVLELTEVPLTINGYQDVYQKENYVPRSDPFEQWDVLFMILKSPASGYPSIGYIFMRYLQAIEGQEFTAGVDYDLDRLYCLSPNVNEIIVNVNVPEEKVLYMLYPQYSNRWPVSSFMPEIEVRDDSDNILFCSTRAVGSVGMTVPDEANPGSNKNIYVPAYGSYLTTYYVVAANKSHKIKVRSKPEHRTQNALPFLSTIPYNNNVRISKTDRSLLPAQLLSDVAVKLPSGYFTIHASIHSKDMELDILDEWVYVSQYDLLCPWWDGRVPENQLVSFKEYGKYATRSSRLLTAEYTVQPREIIYVFVGYLKRSPNSINNYYSYSMDTREEYRTGDKIKFSDVLLLSNGFVYDTDIGDGRYPWKPVRMADKLYWQEQSTSNAYHNDCYLPDYEENFYGIYQYVDYFNQSNSLPPSQVRDWTRIRHFVIEQYNDLTIEPIVNKYSFHSAGVIIIRPGVENALTGYQGTIDTTEYTTIFDNHKISYGHPLTVTKYDLIPKHKLGVRDFGGGDFLDCIVSEISSNITYIHADKTPTSQNTIEIQLVSGQWFSKPVVPKVDGVDVPILFVKLVNTDSTIYLYELDRVYYGLLDGVFCALRYFTSSQEVYLINVKDQFKATTIPFSRSPIMYIDDDSLINASLATKLLCRIQWYNSVTQKVVSEVIDPTTEKRVFTSAGYYPGTPYDTLNKGAVTTISQNTVKPVSTPARFDFRGNARYMYRTNWVLTEQLSQNWEYNGGYQWAYQDSSLFLKMNPYTSQFKVDVIDSSNRNLRFSNIMYLPSEQASAVEYRFKRPAAIVTTEYNDASERVGGINVFLAENPGWGPKWFYPPSGSGVNGYLQLPVPPALASTGVYERDTTRNTDAYWTNGDRARHCRLTEEIGVFPIDFFSFDGPQGLRCSKLKLKLSWVLPTGHVANGGTYLNGLSPHFPIWEVYLFDLATLSHKVYRLQRPVKFANQIDPVLEIDTAGMVSPVLVVPSIPTIQVTPPYTGWGTGNPYFMMTTVNYEIEYTHSGNVTVDLDEGAFFPIRMLDQPIQVSYTFDTFAPAVIEVESYNNENFAITHIKSSPEIINLNNANRIKYYFVPEVGGKIQIDLYNTSGIVKINTVETRTPTNYDLFYIEAIEGSASFINLDGVESTSEFWTFTGEDPSSITVTLYDENGNYEVFNDPQQVPLSVVAGYKFMSVVSSVTTVITVLVDAVESVDIDETILKGLYTISRTVGFTPTDILTIHNNSNEYIYYYVKFPESVTATILLQGAERTFRSNLVIQPPHTEVVLRAVATEVITGAVFKLTRAYPKEMSSNMTIETFLQATLIKTPLMTDTTKNYILSTTTGTMLVVKPSEIVDSEVTAYSLEHNKQVTMIVFPDGAGTKLIKSVYTNYPIRTLYEDKYEDRRFSAVVAYNEQIEIQYNNPEVNGEFYAIDSSSPYPYVRNNYKITTYNYQSYGRDTDRSGYNISVNGTIMSFDVYPRFKRGN